MLLPLLVQTARQKGHGSALSRALLLTRLLLLLRPAAQQLRRSVALRTHALAAPDEVLDGAVRQDLGAGGAEHFHVLLECEHLDGRVRQNLGAAAAAGTGSSDGTASSEGAYYIGSSSCMGRLDGRTWWGPGRRRQVRCEAGEGGLETRYRCTLYRCYAPWDGAVR